MVRHCAHSPSKPRRSTAWGGPRKGAGRKPKGKTSGVSHASRPRIRRGGRALVTLFLVPRLPELRWGPGARALGEALEALDGRFGCDLEHASLHGDHLHLLIGVRAPRELPRAMASLSVRLARALRRIGKRAGPVFADRYEARELIGERAWRAARRDPCAHRAAPERVTPYRPVTCRRPRRRARLRFLVAVPPAPQCVSSAMRARKRGPSSAAFLSPTPLIARNSTLVRGFLAASSARVRSLKIR